MALFTIALIAPEHYQAIRRLLDGHLPDTYDEWNYLHFKEVAETKGRGHTVQEVPIHPSDFTRYLNTTKAAADLDSLIRFAIEEATRKND